MKHKQIIRHRESGVEYFSNSCLNLLQHDIHFFLYDRNKQMVSLFIHKQTLYDHMGSDKIIGYDFQAVLAWVSNIEIVSEEEGE